VAECKPASGTTIADMVHRAAAVLNDTEQGYEHVQWSKGDLVTYLNEALCELSAHRPDAFVEQVELSLVQGARQVVPSKYTALLSLDYNLPRGASLDDGIAGGKISPVSSDFAAVFSDENSCFAGGSSCGIPVTHDDHPPSYEVKSYTMNKLDDRVFYVKPPVPIGETASVVATVQKVPVRHSTSHMKKCLDVACKYESALLDWMLMRAWERDVESEFARQAAKAHREHFYGSIMAKYNQEAQFHSEYWRGRTPADDPNPYMARRDKT